jgi:hypothetical protein
VTSPDPRIQSAIAADLLDQGANLDRTSRLVAAATLIALALQGVFGPAGWVGPVALGAALLLAIVQALFALRTAFDAALFRRLSAEPDLATLDAAMLALDLMPTDKAGRPLAERVAGARRLLTYQGLALAGQIALPVFLIVDR